MIYIIISIISIIFMLCTLALSFCLVHRFSFPSENAPSSPAAPLPFEQSMAFFNKPFFWDCYCYHLGGLIVVFCYLDASGGGRRTTRFVSSPIKNLTHSDPHQFPQHSTQHQPTFFNRYVFKAHRTYIFCGCVCVIPSPPSPTRSPHQLSPPQCSSANS